jgi:hypothetical protein
VVNGDPRHSHHRSIIVDVESRERNEWNENLEFMPKFDAKWLEDDECGVWLLKARGNALEEGCHNLMEV